MKRGIDIIRALYPEPSEYDRWLTLRSFTAADQDFRWIPPLWRTQTAPIQWTFDGLFSRDVQ